MNANAETDLLIATLSFGTAGSHHGQAVRVEHTQNSCDSQAINAIRILNDLATVRTSPSTRRPYLRTVSSSKGGAITTFALE
jgi:hypothetical protein